MGFIEFLKNKLFSSNEVTPIQENQNIQESQNNDFIQHTNSTYNENSETSHTVQIDLASILLNAALNPTERTKRKPMFHRTIEEEELHLNFSMKNCEYLKKKENELVELNIKANEPIKDVDITINNCKKAIKAFYNLKKFCYKTDGGVIYFQHMWENLYNIKYPCFIEKTEKRLQDLTENYDERKRYYQRRQYAINHLKTDLITLISNQENILQKDIYSHFDADLKDNVSRMLYDMDKKGEIKRVKHGSTYQLSIK